jgi:hypothetical protein
MPRVEPGTDWLSDSDRIFRPDATNGGLGVALSGGGDLDGDDQADRISITSRGEALLLPRTLW